VTPNVTWPDVVYYNSYTHPYMGWKINVVDNFNRRAYLRSGAVNNAAPSAFALVAMAAVAIACCATIRTS
jgi:hypothetical protein